MELNTKDNGWMEWEMDLENKFGQMDRYMKGNGNKINQMDMYLIKK